MAVEDLHATYRIREILRGVTLDVWAGEVVGVIGPNGAGKSTLLKAVAGVLQSWGGIVRGDVFLDGANITSRTPLERTRAGVRYLLQGGEVFPNLTVDENLEVGGRGLAAEFESQRGFVLSLFPALRRARGKRAGLLSGGERQMLALSLVLMVRPKLLLLDEPTAGLAPPAAEAIGAAVNEVRKKYGAAVLMVEQNIDKCLALSDRVYLMSEGVIVDEGTPATIVGDGKIEKLFFHDVIKGNHQPQQETSL